MDNLDDVQHPSDFAIASLSKLDGSLRCPICGEIFDGPVILPCGHTFCSLCVRNVLPTKPECPSCRAPAKEHQLVRNATFEDAVAAWSESRAQILQLSNDSVKLARGTKRKLSRQVSDPEAGPSKILRRGSDHNKSVHAFEQEEGEGHLDANDEETSGVRIVVCPMCQSQIVYKNINAHIESNCEKHVADNVDISTARQKQGTTSKSTWNAIFNRREKKPADGYSAEDSQIPTKKLAKVSYGTLKMTELRKLLGEHRLSTVGEKQELIQRHQRWIAIYNANLDRGQPKPRDLKRQLQELEEVKSRPGPRKIEDEKEYTRKHGAHFEELIRKARPKSKSTMETTSTEDSNNSPDPRLQKQPEVSPHPPSTTPDIIEIDD